MVAPRIFVSHSSLDDAVTRQLVTDLRMGGAQVWMDETDVKQGDFIHKINEGLANCDWMVLILTPSALQSKAVEMEVNAALNLVRLGRLQGVVPFRAVPCDMSQVPPMWATLHYYDGVKDYQGALAGLLRAFDLDPQASNPLTAQPLVPNTGYPTPAAPLSMPISMPNPATNPGYRPPAPSYPLPGSGGMPGMPPGAAPGHAVPPNYGTPQAYPPVGGYAPPPAAPVQPGPMMPPRMAYNVPVAAPDPLAWQAMLATGLGAFGLIAWFIPLCGFPVTIAALVFGYLGLRSPTRKTWAIVGIVLAIIGLVLTIANSAIGAYMGFTGKL